jgi:hypothetical protein
MIGMWTRRWCLQSVAIVTVAGSACGCSGLGFIEAGGAIGKERSAVSVGAVGGLGLSTEYVGYGRR